MYQWWDHWKWPRSLVKKCRRLQMHRYSYWAGSPYNYMIWDVDIIHAAENVVNIPFIRLYIYIYIYIYIIYKTNILKLSMSTIKGDVQLSLNGSCFRFYCTRIAKKCYKIFIFTLTGLDLFHKTVFKIEELSFNVLSKINALLNISLN